MLPSAAFQGPTEREAHDAVRTEGSRAARRDAPRCGSALLHGGRGTAPAGRGQRRNPRPSFAAAPSARVDGLAEKPDGASAHFQNLVLNLARQAAASLGATRHPLTGQIEIDLEAAQQMIALLQALRLKTQGNRSADETELLEGLIADLQMQYVATRSKATQKP
jgi:hypothetical protein